MATDLSDSLDSLRFTVARPGMFSAYYPETDDDMLLQVLADGLAECHLEGLLLDYEADTDGIVATDLASGQLSMVILFAAVRFMRAELMNRTTSVVYAAGTARYETTQATNILRDAMKALEAQKNRLIDLVAISGAESAFYMADQYAARLAYDYYPIFGDYALTGW